MTVTKRYCDMCHSEITDKQKLETYTLPIVINPYDIFNPIIQNKKFDLCINCAVALNEFVDKYNFNRKQKEREESNGK